MSDNIKNKLSLFAPSFIVLIVDQLTKALVAGVKKKGMIELYDKVNILGDFLVFQHVRNKGAGFGLGGHLSGFLRIVVLYILPLILVAGIIYILLNTQRYKIETKCEKISLALIIGGGLGNMIDRIFRSSGVVDFINIKVYGFLGYEYWPTFNIADASVVVGMVLLLLFTLIINPVKNKKTDENSVRR